MAGITDISLQLQTIITAYNQWLTPFFTGLQVSSILLQPMMTDESLLTHWTPPVWQMLSPFKNKLSIKTLDKLKWEHNL
jgi:hypothetical protein